MADAEANRRGCAAAEADVSALLDGELAAPAAAAVEAHLRSCPACAALARDLASVSRTLRAAEAGAAPVAVSAGFRSRVLASVAAGGGRRAGVRSLPASPAEPSRILRWVPFAAAAASALAVAGLGAAIRFGGVEPGATTAGATAADREPSAVDFLARAGRHRGEGRSDLERLDLVAAYGLAPEDPEVREAFARGFGFDPSALDGFGPGPSGPERTATEGGVAAASAGAEGSADEGGGGLPALWIGPWRFTAPGACDEFLTFRERSREAEIAQAAREAALAPETRTVAATREEAGAPDPVARAFASLRVGTPVGGNGSVQYPGIVVYPLHRVAGGVPPSPGEAMTLEEALETRRAEVLETAGRAPGAVLVSNLDPGRPLLVLAGEVLHGGRADRMVARDALVPAGARNVPLPVYDVDVGRARGTYGTRFRSVPGVAGVRLRGLAVGRAASEDLAEFVRDRLTLLDVTASRRSLADAYSDRGPAALYLRAARPEAAALLKGLQAPDVVGFAVAQGRDLLAVEIFGSHRLMEAHAARVLEGSALEGRTFARGGARPAVADVAAMLEAAGRGSAFGSPAGASSEVGLLALEGGLMGSGAVGGDALYHAVVFRGAGAGAIAGRGARGGDLPGGGAPPAEPPGAGEGGEGGAAPDGGAGGPSSTAGDEGGKKSPDSPPPAERPR